MSINVLFKFITFVLLTGFTALSIYFIAMTVEYQNLMYIIPAFGFFCCSLVTATALEPDHLKQHRSNSDE